MLLLYLWIPQDQAKTWYPILAHLLDRMVALVQYTTVN
jgi:hypothetical protein